MISSNQIAKLGSAGGPAASLESAVSELALPPCCCPRGGRVSPRRHRRRRSKQPGNEVQSWLLLFFHLSNRAQAIFFR